MVLRSQKGAAFADFALINTVFFIILFAGINLSLVVYQSVAIKYVLSESLRWGVVGQNALAIENRIISRGKQFGLTLNAEDIKICPVSNLACTTESAGGPNNYFNATVLRKISLFPLAISITQVYSLKAKNEQYV